MNDPWLQAVDLFARHVRLVAIRPLPTEEGDQPRAEVILEADEVDPFPAGRGTAVARLVLLRHVGEVDLVEITRPDGSRSRWGEVLADEDPDEYLVDPNFFDKVEALSDLKGVLCRLLIEHELQRQQMAPKLRAARA